MVSYVSFIQLEEFKSSEFTWQTVGIFTQRALVEIHACSKFPYDVIIWIIDWHNEVEFQIGTMVNSTTQGPLHIISGHFKDCQVIFPSLKSISLDKINVYIKTVKQGLNQLYNPSCKKLQGFYKKLASKLI